MNKPPVNPSVSSSDQSIDDHHNDIFFAAVSKTRMPMIVTDPHQPDNPIIFANNAFVAMTGYTLDEIVGHNCRFLQSKDTDRETIADVREAITAKRDISTEVLNYRKDGSTFWNALFISPVLNQAGDVVYYFASQLDVSRRRDAEDALHQSQKMEALGQLTGGIAHDFNNLLQVMTGYLDILDLGVDRNVSVPTLHGNVDKIRSAVTKASTLTQQLLAFARKQRLSGRVINLNTLVGGMVELASRTLGGHVTLQTDLHASLRNCRVDTTQLEVSLLNVLLNARDALGEQADAKVVVQTANVELESRQVVGFADLSPGHYVSIAVSDNGPGIPSQIIDRVMDPFFTTKEEGKGTGLGLSMVYGFVKQSGGAVNIYSEVGIGTTLRFYFPAVSDDELGHVPPVKMIEQGGTETVLVVDDRPEVAEVAQAMLEQMGYATHIAFSGKEGLQLLVEHPDIDMVFTDLIMPGNMNGVMLAREARKINPAIKVLLTTGYADASLEHTDARGSEFDVLHKPYGRAALARKVRIVLNGHTGVA